MIQQTQQNVITNKPASRFAALISPIKQTNLRPNSNNTSNRGRLKPGGSRMVVLQKRGGRGRGISKIIPSVPKPIKLETPIQKSNTKEAAWSSNKQPTENGTEQKVNPWHVSPPSVVTLNKIKNDTIDSKTKGQSMFQIFNLIINILEQKSEQKSSKESKPVEDAKKIIETKSAQDEKKIIETKEKYVLFKL